MTITYTTYTATGRRENHSGTVIKQEGNFIIYIDQDHIQHKINITSPHFYNLEIK